MNDDLINLYIKRSRLGILLASGIKGSDYKKTLKAYMAVQAEIKMRRLGK